jgi:hypothetical protein
LDEQPKINAKPLRASHPLKSAAAFAAIGLFFVWAGVMGLKNLSVSDFATGKNNHQLSGSDFAGSVALVFLLPLGVVLLLQLQSTLLRSVSAPLWSKLVVFLSVKHTYLR